MHGASALPIAAVCWVVTSRLWIAAEPVAPRNDVEGMCAVT